MDAQLTCHTCGHTTTPLVRQNGPHLEAVCPECKAHLRFLPQPLTELKIYWGKYTGRRIGEVQDAGWLSWCYDNIRTLNSRYRQALKEQIERLRYQTA
ncbi:hypothetical protein [Larkinella soli]|uniref:hypothetical protein n=1 Tax=Larkinella soli TaxID=1770527 RepID=UPI000FFCB6A6|nr:hypothetical protein [Larkinella soli]